MYATVRRYEGIDKVRSEEITRKVVGSLAPNSSELPGSALTYAPQVTAGPLIALEPQREVQP